MPRQLQADETPSGAGTDDRLESWKEIAAYFGRGVSTVQRWEREEHLPVHRIHDSLGSVYAFKSELEAWRKGRTGIDDHQPLRRPPAPRAWGPWQRRGLIAAVLVAAAGVGAQLARMGMPASERPVRHVSIVLPQPAAIVSTGADRNLTITPDGNRIVYVGGTPTARRLFVRAMDQSESVAIADTVSPRYPFVSPDGQWIGFMQSFALKKVPVTGGPASVITNAQPGEVFLRGATWGPDNTIVYSAGNKLLRIPANGGVPQLLAVSAEKEQTAYRWPEYLPGGTALLFTIMRLGDLGDTGATNMAANAKVAVLNLENRQTKILVDGGSHARYVPSGHLVYGAAGALKAVAFDLDKLAVSGTPKTIVSNLEMTQDAAANFDVSRDGTLVYTTGGVQNDFAEFIWADRTGREERLPIPPFPYRDARLSPDGTRIAFGSNRDLGMWDINARTVSWFGVGPARSPVWTPDGQGLVVALNRDGAWNVYRQVVDGARSLTRLTEKASLPLPQDISPDGRYVSIREAADADRLMVLELGGNRAAQPVIREGVGALGGHFSPDGRLLAYTSSETGQQDVYVQPFPNQGIKAWKVSTGGGTRPMWAPKGGELFYLSPTGIVMSVKIQLRGGNFSMASPEPLFGGVLYPLISPSPWTYQPAPDGRHFLITRPVSRSDTRAANINVVLNWDVDLERQMAR